MATRERERRERQLTPLEAFAASRISGGRGEGGNQDPFALAMKLLDMQKEESRDVKDREYKDRIAEAEEMWRRGQLEHGMAQERREMETLAETKRIDAEREATRQREREEDIAHRTEQERLVGEEKTAAKLAAEKKAASETFDDLVNRGIIDPKSKAGIARAEQLDPEYAKLARNIKVQEDEAAFKKGIENYQKLSPKDRTRALPESFGGPEVFQRIKDAAQGYTYEPGSPSAMPGRIGTYKPQLEPEVGAPPPTVGYGQAPQEAPQEYSYTTRAPQQTVPVVGGMTEPVNMSPIADLQGELLTGAMYNPAGMIDLAKRAIMAPSPVDFRNVPNTINYLDKLLKRSREPEFEYLAGGPSAIPPEIY